MIGDEYLQQRAQLGTALFSLAGVARELEAGPEVAATLHALDANLREPFLFVVVGEVKAGKSSLLNAIFGREMCRTDVLPATDKVYHFKHGTPDHDEHVSDALAVCQRGDLFLRDFQIVDTPGTNTILARHQTITQEFVPMADVVLFVFSITNPWAGSAWEFLGYVHDEWLKNVVFVVQQCDLRSPEEVQSILGHLRETLRDKLKCDAPIFAVSARQALQAKREGNAELLAASGFEALERCISERASRGNARLGKLQSTAQTGQILLRQVSDKARAGFTIVKQDTERLRHLQLSLEDRKEQSLRQIGGVLWTLAQAYEQSQKRGEQLLTEKLSLGNTLRLLVSKAAWREEFRRDVEGRLQESIQSHMQAAIGLIEADLREVWGQLHDSLERNFKQAGNIRAAAPDFIAEREELLRRIEQTLVEKSSDQQIEQQMSRLFAETATWLRIPAGVAAAGGVATVVAALAHVAVLDLTGTIAGLAALFGTVVAIVKRNRILAEFRAQMTGKREGVLSEIEGHLRQAIDHFYAELQTAFAPLQTFCAAQRRRFEPQLARVKQLADRLELISGALGTEPRGSSVSVTRS